MPMEGMQYKNSIGGKSQFDVENYYITKLVDIEKLEHLDEKRFKGSTRMHW